MYALSAAQDLVTLALWVGLLALKGFALVDALRFSDATYKAVDKQPKTFWLLLLGLSLATGFLVSPLNLLGIAGTVVTLVYLFGIRPELQRYRGVGRGRSSADGPYGGW
jgi:hypothetical protein